ncbi:rhodanese-like domain-containing protein [uncultured Pseudoxanthomonas sp.]|uniref:rhodanese-like domain-containing protein n=1 Tax=uncultured Pseudoxanthomonas sp. TaxID=281701 RepID=UPI00260A4F66|nr:rhodanese-like domain-containing protein [uncultured Pseudoxanthomonas sp.]
MARTVQNLVIEARSRIQEIAPDQLAAQDDCVLIDVREPAEYVQGHLPGAINLPRGVLEFQIHAHPAMACDTSEALALPDRELILYCLTGGRSALAADSLQALGFTRVRSLAGGLTAWRNAGHPLTPETA